MSKPVQMQRRHFELVAAAINSAPGYVEELASVAKALADVFMETNPRFDRDRFLKACGVDV